MVTLILTAGVSLLISDSFRVHDDGSVSLAQGAAVDAPYHLGQIIRMGTTRTLDFEEPNFAGEFIRYPFLINLFSGILLRLGAPLGFAYHAPLVLLLFSGIFLLITLFGSIGLSKYFIMVAVLVILFGSGWGYLAWFENTGLEGVSLPIRNGVPYPMQNISYPGMVPGFLVVQRPFFLGLPLFLFAVLAFLRGVQRNHLFSFLWAGVITGLLPFAHSHSFIAMMLFGGAAITTLFLIRNLAFFHAVRGFLMPALVLAMPQLAAFLLLPRYPLGNAISFRLGWMSSPGQIGGLNLFLPDAGRLLPWLRYFWTNFGVLLALPSFLCVVLMKKIKFLSREALPGMVLAFGSLALWVIPNIIQFQTWDFDTNKFFSYAILLSLAAVGVFVMRFPVTVQKKLLISLSFLLLLSLPSNLIASWENLRAGEGSRITLFTEKERRAAAWIREHTPEDAVILSSAAILDVESLQNPVVILAGRKTTVGFTTWLHTHGIDFLDRLAAVEGFFAYPERGLNISEESVVPADYLLIDETLRARYPKLESRLGALGYPTLYEADEFSLILLRR